MDRPVYLTPYTLSIWIPQLAAEKKLYKFYKTPEFQALRKQVLAANHYECEDCRAKSPTVITRATEVHHDREVKRYPELALSLYYIDSHGRKRKQLYALCEDCHNARHNRMGHHAGDTPGATLTPERW